MTDQLLPLLGTGFLLGWSVAWPPGPINAEVARRCLARGFWAGFVVLLGASSMDAVWAVVVSLGVGALFTAPAIREAMGIVSILLLVVLAGLFLRSARRAWSAGPAACAPDARGRFDGRRASFAIGAAMALTSPWNVAFWIAAIGRPEMNGLPTRSLLVMAAAVIAGALTWGVLWSGSVTLFRGRTKSEAAGRWWNVGVNLATGFLMAWFAVQSATRLLGGG